MTTIQSKISAVAENSETPKFAQTAAITVVLADPHKEMDYWRSVNASNSSINAADATRTKPLYKDKTFDSLYSKDDSSKVEGFLSDIEGKYSVPGTTVPLRHKYILGKLKEFALQAEQSEKQVVLFGSGYSTYAVRKNDGKYNNVKYFEVDFPEVLEAKKELYTTKQINPNAVYIGSSYTDPQFFENLQNHGVDFKKDTLVIWEGNSMYLDIDKVRGVLNNVFQKFEGSTSVCFDSFSPELVNGTTGSPALGKFTARMAVGKYPFTLGLSEGDREGLGRENKVSCECFNLNDLAKTYKVGQSIPDGEHAGVTTLSRGPLNREIGKKGVSIGL